MPSTVLDNVVYVEKNKPLSTSSGSLLSNGKRGIKLQCNMINTVLRNIQGSMRYQERLSGGQVFREVRRKLEECSKQRE